MNMKETPSKLAHALLLPINPAAVVLLGIYTTVWGLWLASPFWTVFTQAPLYRILAHVPPDVIPAEYFWGLVAVGCGCIIMYGAVKRGFRALTIGAAVAFWHWSMIAVFYFWGDWQNTGGITATIFCVYAAFVYINIRVNYKYRKQSYGISGP